MSKPTFTDYVAILRQLFGQYQQAEPAPKRRGPRYTYGQLSLILFFTVMLLRRIFAFKAQRRWLQAHPEAWEVFGFKRVPARTTLSRRYKQLYDLVQGFVASVGQWAEDLDEAFHGKDLFEDKSLFKAQGPVWHQSDRKAGVIPEGLRNLDTEASWSKSPYHGWVYGYGIHGTTTRTGFPTAVQVETAARSESKVIDEKAAVIWASAPETLTGDNSYCHLRRIRRWACQGVALVTPALTVSAATPAGAAYKAFLQQPEQQALLKARKTAIEPCFDLLSRVVGAGDHQKQLPVKGLANVRSCLTLGTLLLQIAMVVNSIWGMPLHGISHMIAVFT